MTTPTSASFSRRRFVKNIAAAGIGFSIIPRYVMGRGFTAPSDRITLGFIGTGKQARGLINSFAPKAQAVAAADVDAQKLALFKSNTEKLYAAGKGLAGFKTLDTYADFRELLARRDIDAVVIATPDHWHAVHTIMAANTGKHVYCEKPLAHSIEEGRAMVNAVKRNNIVLQTGSMQRSWKNFRQACELVRNGYIGDVKEVLVNVGKPAIADDLPEQPVPAALNWDAWVGPAPFKAFNAELAPPVEKDIFPNWRNYREYGGGILSDWGAHMFDIAQWALGMDRSAPVQFYPPDGKEHQYLTMVYANGVVMKHQDFGRNFGVRFIGSKGTLDISRDYLDSNPANIATAIIPDNAVRLYHSDDHYQDWLDGIKNNRQPICDVETGHRTASVCCLANITYWLNRPLQWNPEQEKFVNDDAANALVKANIRAPWKIV
ncbi:Gfo/Idh/MocA family protein [Deminuibacter soli]|uniref:Gfo/Idh/MocA family oxidoreductase n=1 Tax=Deminuibacter soli TaxID=2291815 RepID=A0A3E1NHN6_9BACT|nr:Gfo/Idh/MocA family oxidoreductase [Deminuibacter soli]RFM27354.1 gfo/Idh/MocA family oxidoreductase [Deminuibacter soli]